MDQTSSLFTVNSKITFCEAEGDDAPRYTGLVKKTKESLVALIVSNKDKGAILPDVGAPIYFPFEREGEPWQATARVAQNSSWPLLILELEGEAPVGAADEDPPRYYEEEPTAEESPFPADGSHLGDVEQADDDLISLPERDESTSPVEPLAENDELTDEELAAAEAGAEEALGGDDLMAGLPEMPDPLKDLPEIDDAELAAELEADMNEAITQPSSLDTDGDGFDDDLDEMAMVETHDIDMDEASDDHRIGSFDDNEDDTADLTEIVDEEEGPLLSWDQTSPVGADPTEEAAELVSVDEAIEEEPENPPMAETPLEDQTAALPPGLLAEPEDNREFFPVTVLLGDTPSLPTGVDPGVASIIGHLQQRLARLEASVGEAASPPLTVGPNGFCLALGLDHMTVALPSGCALSVGDEVTLSVDHRWRDPLLFEVAATVSDHRDEEGVSIISFRFDRIEQEGERAIENYLEGIADWRNLLSRLSVS